MDPKGGKEHYYKRERKRRGKGSLKEEKSCKWEKIEGYNAPRTLSEDLKPCNPH